jgi:hypothetical protein
LDFQVAVARDAARLSHVIDHLRRPLFAGGAQKALVVVLVVPIYASERNMSMSRVDRVTKRRPSVAEKRNTHIKPTHGHDHDGGFGVDATVISCTRVETAGRQ